MKAQLSEPNKCSNRTCLCRNPAQYVLVPDPLFPGFEDSAIEPRSSNEDAEDDAAEARGECTLEDNVRPGSLTLIRYHSVGFEEYQAQAKDSISELTSVLDFHLANCASLMVNRTLMDSLAKPAGGGGAPFTAMLGVATDPCAALLADRLRIRRRAAYDDGSATSLLWGVLLGQGHATSHVAAYGTGLGGGGSMGLYQVRACACVRTKTQFKGVYVCRHIAKCSKPTGLRSKQCGAEEGSMAFFEGGYPRLLGTGALCEVQLP